MADQVIYASGAASLFAVTARGVDENRVFKARAHPEAWVHHYADKFGLLCCHRFEKTMVEIGENASIDCPKCIEIAQRARQKGWTE